MKVLIIEDEVQTGLDLQRSIEKLQPDFKVVGIVDSVEASLEWFDKNETPDIIFSDIQLGDGLAFDIFKQVSIDCPVIFCTAYDQYAIQAFQNNGIDYLLKPVEDSLLEKSLRKFHSFTRSSNVGIHKTTIERLLREISGNIKSYKSTFLVSYRDKMIPVSVDEILFFRITDDVVELYTIDKRQYRLTDSLDYVESVVDPRSFYRANRQYLLAFSSIKEVEVYIERKLLVRLIQPGIEPVIISKAKASDFLKWVEAR
jgi:DNA-binding LytR/AlgR family response regulator